VVDSQGFSPCKTTLSRLSFWDQIYDQFGCKKQIDTMVILGKQNEAKHIGVCLHGYITSEEGRKS
jgi:hypothetical protein